MIDLVVCGAGPAGLETARGCSGSMDVVVMEEHARIGVPNHCSGLVSRNIENIAKPEPGCIEHRVRGAILHSPGGVSLTLKKGGFAAYVLNREKFDQQLARNAGCDILRGSKITGVKFHRERVEIMVGRKRVSCRAVVGADGAGSVVARAMGARPRHLMPGIIAIENKEDCSDFVEMWFDKGKTDCFLWKIPRGRTTEYGMWGDGSGFRVLEKFFGIRRYEKRAGVIPIGPPKTYRSRALLVGDAAAQTKPWSGGGVVYAMTCARIASKTLRSSSDFSESELREYEIGWRKAVGRSMDAGMLMRRLYSRTSGSQVDKLMSSARHLRLLNRLDMDFLAGRAK